MAQCGDWEGPLLNLDWLLSAALHTIRQELQMKGVFDNDAQAHSRSENVSRASTYCPGWRDRVRARSGK